MQLEGLGKLKNTITSLGIKSVTFRLVAMCLNYVTMCPLHVHVYKGYWWESQKQRDHKEVQDIGGWII
jgi:riboflavin transporter FmnP